MRMSMIQEVYKKIINFLIKEFQSVIQIVIHNEDKIFLEEENSMIKVFVNRPKHLKIHF